MDITTHLETLADDDARAFRSVIRLLKAQPEAEPSPGLHNRIAAQLPAQRKMPSFWRWGIPIAASLTVLLGVARVLQHRSPTENGDIRWLAENQETDGTWNPARHGGAEPFRPALTALSLLALREANGVGGHTGQIAKGLSALERLQTVEGAFGGDGGQSQLYNLAITTYALATCEADNATLSRAVTHIGTSQQPDGSWTYTQEGNAAVTAWMTRALVCAEAQGVVEARVPLRKGLRWLRDNVRDDGRMAYHPASAPSDTLTALSAHSLIVAGKTFPDLQALGIRMADALNTQPSAAAPSDCYRDYAKIIAFESAGNTASADAIRNQIRQRPPAAHDQWGVAGGQVYTVALTTLSRAH